MKMEGNVLLLKNWKVSSFIACSLQILQLYLSSNDLLMYLGNNVQQSHNNNDKYYLRIIIWVAVNEMATNTDTLIVGPP